MQDNFRHPLATFAALTVLGYRRNGSPIYAIAGGADDGDGGNTDTGQGVGDQGAQGDGQGGTGDAGKGADDGATDWEAKYRDAIAHSRTWEQRAKDNKAAADERDRLKAERMTNQEKAVADAQAQGRTAARAEAAPEIAQARLEAAAARKGVDLAPFADLIDVRKFVGEDGAVDQAAITAAVDKFQQLAPKPAAGRSGAGAPHTGDGGEAKRPTSLGQAVSRRLGGRS
ncbi:hypothetical protein ACWENS_05590 [Streptomyces sp. NPDC004532]